MTTKRKRLRTPPRRKSIRARRFVSYSDDSVINDGSGTEPLSVVSDYRDSSDYLSQSEPKTPGTVETSDTDDEASAPKKIRFSIASLRKPLTSKPTVRKRNAGNARVVAKSITSSEVGGLNHDSDDELDESGQKIRDRTAKFEDTFILRNGIAEELPPLTTVKEIFSDLTDKIKAEGFIDFINHIKDRPLNVATMCSGTESPILALLHVAQNLKTEGINLGLNHIFSAEIVPWKQHYIERNFHPPIIFSDVVELSLENPNPSKPRTAKTAYGGMAEVPGNVDILISGFCCVDFSQLNNSRKTLESNGESGDTFFAMRSYAREYRPKIIILENVSGAPWLDAKQLNTDKRGIDFHMKQVGYSSRFVRMDTKDYYIPHTRVRGYMVCIDENASPDLQKLNGMLDKWEQLVKKLKRPASVPVDAMLLAADDPRLAVTWSDDSHLTRKATPWEKCKGGHLDYRSALGLGVKRELTNWNSAGSKVLPDFFKKTKGLTERVLDTLDIAHLRSLLRGYDDREYSRMYELSQNVFRVTDVTKMGHIGCLTPNGIPFSSVRGGKIIGYEAVVLQGLPIEQLDVSQLSQSQLQDLAGNAMSSPVVGVAILAALNIFYEILESGKEAIPVEDPSIETRFQSGGALLLKTSDPAEYNLLSAESAMHEAALTGRLCSCEGRYDIFSTTFQQCQVCKHTTCVSCGKNPKHHYKIVPQQIINSRKDPKEFAELIKKSIPMKISLTGLSLPDLKSQLNKFRGMPKNIIDENVWYLAIEAIGSAMVSDVYFRTVRRTARWEVVYDSSKAKLMLLISRDSVEWLLYAKVSTEEPGNSPLRLYLQQFPFARMTPEGNDINKGAWSFWLPDEREISAVISGQGQLVRSFEAARGLAIFADTFVWNSTVVEIEDNDVKLFDHDIRGEYELSQDCGQAFNSLHVQVNSKGSRRPFFLYFDHQLQTGHPKHHFFIFTHDKRRLDFGEYHPTVGRLSRSWRQPKIHGVPSVDSSEFKVDQDVELVNKSKVKSKQQVNIYVDGRWVDFPMINFNPVPAQLVNYRHLPKDLSHFRNESCQSHQTFFACKARIPDIASQPWRRNKWTLVGQANENDFFQDFCWIFQRGLVIDGHSQDDHNWQAATAGVAVSRCLRCAPKHPKMLWTFNKEGKQVPFEEPKEGSEYERALKNRTPPIIIAFHIDNMNKIKIKIAMNPETLIHRAIARLMSGTCVENVTTSWRLVTSDSTTSKPQLNEFSLLSNDEVKMAAQPPNFAPQYFLRPEQLRCLAWMIRQETHPMPFINEEIVESRIPQIGYRVEGRATQPIIVRGGVQAQDVGFGKTATILGLIDSQLQTDIMEAKGAVSGFIPLKATIIFVPPQLPEQWENEIRKFLPRKENGQVLVIKNTQKLRGLTIADFQAADVIIVNWRVCEGSSYMLALAQFVGMVEPYDNATSRAKFTWYQTALRKAEENVNELMTNAAGLWSKIDHEYALNVKESESLVAPLPSKRIIGAAYVDVVKRQKLTTQNKIHVPNQSKKGIKAQKDEQLQVRSDIFLLKNIRNKSWRSMKSPLFEMFRFARIVVDEYTYVTGNESRVIEKINANCRWILSGTPSLGGFSDIKIMAKFLGINLGVDDLSTCKPDASKNASSEFSTAELFLAYQTAPSPTWQERRHAHAGEFLTQFVRKDVADIKKIECSEHFRLVQQPAAERAIYLELTQKLAATDFKPKRIRPAGSDMDRQIDDVLAGCDDGKEALILRAAHFTLLEDDIQELPQGNPQNAFKVCELIVHIRRRQYEELKEIFQKVLKQAQWLQVNKEAPCPNLENWKARIINGNHYGDSGATTEMMKLIDEANRNYAEDDWMQFYRDGEDSEENAHLAKLPVGMNDSHGTSHLYRKVAALRLVTTKLNKLAEELVNRIRSLRFFRGVRSIQSLSTQLSNGGELGSGLSCSKCGSTGLRPSDIILLGQCGHLICNRGCLLIDDDECPLVGCDATNKSYQRLSGDELGAEHDSDSASRFGKKLDEILYLIRKIPPDEKVLLFVQFPTLLKKIQEALASNSIPFADLSIGFSASKILSEFQDGGDTQRKKSKTSTNPARVLVLNIGDVSAAGSNLTIANHIIFVSPYHTQGSSAKQVYDAAMTQAVGRARRYGQQKHVHVYHFLTTKTIDIDIIEERNKKVVKVGSVSAQNKPYPEFVHSGAALVDPQPGDQSEFGSTVAHMLFSESCEVE